MKNLFLFFITITFVMLKAQIPFDTYKTEKREIKITVLGHASLLLQYEGENIYVDPYSPVADYSQLPKASLILITHEHADHLDREAINSIKGNKTSFITSQAVQDELGIGKSLNNGDKTNYKNIQIEAVPAYNLVNKSQNGEFYHPKGIGNGYILTLDNLKIYIAGDTENIPEMENLKGKIDIAFLPKNIPYTMTDSMFIDAIKKIEPKVLYPYHFSNFNEEKIKESLQGLNTVLVARSMSNK